MRCPFANSLQVLHTSPEHLNDPRWGDVRAGCTLIGHVTECLYPVMPTCGKIRGDRAGVTVKSNVGPRTSEDKCLSVFKTDLRLPDPEMKANGSAVQEVPVHGGPL